MSSLSDCKSCFVREAVWDEPLPPPGCNAWFFGERYHEGESINQAIDGAANYMYRLYMYFIELIARPLGNDGAPLEYPRRIQQA